MTLNEIRLKELVSEAYTEMLEEEHLNIVFNLKHAVDLIRKEWETPDDVWFIMIEQRVKDFKLRNKRNGAYPGSTGFKPWYRVSNLDSAPNSNHVGYAVIRGITAEKAVESLLNVQVHLNPWAEKEYGSRIVKSNGYMEGIMLVCNHFFARAYMTINKRSMKSSVERAKNDKTKGLFKKRELLHRLGQQKPNDDATTNWSKIRPYRIIDCDVEDVNGQDELQKQLSDMGIDAMAMQSHDGRHFITKDNRVDNIDFSPYDSKYTAANANTRRTNDPMIEVKPDSNMLLYSPCGF